MQVKLFEIRDEGTFFAVYAFRCRPAPPALDDRWARQQFLLARSGYGTGADSDCVMVGRLEGGAAHYDPYAFPHLYGFPRTSRTMALAVRYIIDNFDSLIDGAVVDVQFILGESAHPKVSERVR